MRHFLDRVLAGLSGSLRVPPESMNMRRTLLHISDTPSIFYTDLSRLIDSVKPRIILHTGDLVDEIKLGHCRGDRALYKKRVEALLRILEGSSARRVILMMGNHDCVQAVRGLAGRSEVFEGCVRLDLEGVEISAAHRADDLWECASALNFYGHDTSVLPPDVDGRLYLNGNVRIRVIDLESRAVLSIDYPRSVHDARQRKRKIGL